MALKPTIFRMKITLSDMDRNYYDTLNLTVAQHPSETLERMMVRVVAFCINAQESLAFTTGLSTPDEPDIAAHSLDDQLLLWVDVGEPGADRIKKATRIAKVVKVYSFNSKSDVWWNMERKKFANLSAEVYQIRWERAQTLASLVERTMEFSVTISDNSAYIATAKGDCELSWQLLQAF